MAKKLPLAILTLFLILVFSIISLSVLVKNENKLVDVNTNNLSVLEDPEISGWVAWWKESQGLDLLSTHRGKISSVSPFCFLILEDYTLENKCSLFSNTENIKPLKENSIKIIPTIGSDLRYEELSPILSDTQLTLQIAEEIYLELISKGYDGVDIDLEGIREEDKDHFTNFIKSFRTVLNRSNLYLSVTLHAQDGKKDYQITKGQDLNAIGSLADEVRIMAYDQHGTFSEPGHIASNKWLADVVAYNTTLVPVTKLVIGIPSYGYIWETSGFSKGYQFDEFNDYIRSNNLSYQTVRDPDSQELVFKSTDYEGWLSDSQSMISKINTARALGVNRFVIWNLGGIDESLFEYKW